MMKALNLPAVTLKIVERNKKKYIFDAIRKKYLQLTQEEWVRQSFIQYLCDYQNYPASLIAVEKALKVNNLLKRTDIVVFDRSGNPKMIIECKAPGVKLNQEVFDQAARYNMSLHVDFLLITNGLEHYCCKMDYANHTYIFLEEIPAFSHLL